jgi:hypothetical protein
LAKTDAGKTDELFVWRRSATHAPDRFACDLHVIEATKEVGDQIAAGSVMARAGGLGCWKIMSYEPFIKLLVVTLRAAWFNFRGWNKRR